MRQFDVFVCPIHGILSDRECDYALLEGHDGTFFGSHPGAEDGYTGEFFCDLEHSHFDGDVHKDWCGEKVEQFVLVEK